MKQRIYQALRLIAKKHGVNSKELIVKLTGNKWTTYADDEVRVIYEFCNASILTRPEMIEYYLGINKNRLSHIISQNFESIKRAA
jgi:hypothetical protein